ncbi:HD domain-containing protein [Bacillus massiliglaciei]|uniref:HD domain-containing protein n=1 Tax=Bacillus massiliglaciei TaxID=1816693 RepID=UPI000AC6746E|nr:HD domain-containing protein [Bacillus massiliglaciei]
MKKEWIEKTEVRVKELLQSDASGHDWFHIDRVRKLALHIAGAEQRGDAFIIEMAALLHDIPDDKIAGSEKAGQVKLQSIYLGIGLSEDMIPKIQEIIDTISFSAGFTALPSAEAEIVQDADRLDALGAIGIARTFAYGGKKGQPMYDPDLPVREMMSKEEYRNGKSSSVHHFYEKILKLEEMLHTDTAKKIAGERHSFIEEFLQQFYKEWDVKL